MQITLESDGTSTQFTLTCISTGGPATNVTWTRDSDTVTEGTETVLDDRVTAQYTHNLTVTETTSFNDTYSCTVSNNKPSSATEVIYTGYGMSLCLRNKYWLLFVAIYIATVCLLF